MRSEDVQMVQLGSSPAMFASLEKGGIDGAVYTIPTFFVAEERGYRILADPVDMDIYYCRIPWIRQRAFYAKNGIQPCAS